MMNGNEMKWRFISFFDDFYFFSKQTFFPLYLFIFILSQPYNYYLYAIFYYK